MPRQAHFLAIAFCAILLAACGQRSIAAPQTPEVTATPQGPQVLNICMASEPSSLYVYADSSNSAAAVRQAIYDGPFDWQGYTPQAILFDSQPAPLIQSVAVRQGDLVVDAFGQVAALVPGTVVRPAGCKDGNCLLTYTEGEVQLDQVSVSFALKPGLLWSDGTELTAGDSVYSFQIAGDDATPTNKDIIRKTTSYTATDERTITWVGLPGYVDPQAELRFWQPLPQHQLGALSAAELLTSEPVARTPLGWGAYSVVQWLQGERIQLTRNPHYAGSPAAFSELNFVFTDDAANALADGRCDLVLPQSSLSSADEIQGARIPQDQWLHLVFGIKSQAYEDGFNVYTDRPNYFGDVAMRLALAQCIDRTQIASIIGGTVASSYIPQGSPYADPAVSLPAYDPATANASLDGLGWLRGEDGLRRSQSFSGAIFGQALELRLAVSDDAQDIAVAELIRANLADCGAQVTIESLPAAELFATGPQSPVFGRNFDMALFAWPFGDQPACYLFLGEAVPGANPNLYKFGWGGWNVSGWQNAEFDSACHTALNTLASDAAHSEAHLTAQAIFTQELPALPLAVPDAVVAARADFCGLEPDLVPGARLLQNIENYAYGSACP